MVRRVGVYNDEGASPWCVECTCSTLVARGYTPVLLTASDVGASSWVAECRGIVFPGGRDTPYHEKLKGRPNQIIRQFVEAGGWYLGLCAGAYYGCSQIEFSKGDPSMEIVAERELAFFPGTGVGPRYPGYCYHDNTGEHVVPITRCVAEARQTGRQTCSCVAESRQTSRQTCSCVAEARQTGRQTCSCVAEARQTGRQTCSCVAESREGEARINGDSEGHARTNGSARTPLSANCNNGSSDHCDDPALCHEHDVHATSTRDNDVTALVYYNGGCWFRADNNSSDYTILWGYPSSTPAPSTPAVVGRRVGAGRVVLSGVHPEVGYMDLCDNDHSWEVVQKMKGREAERKGVLDTIFRFLEES